MALALAVAIAIAAVVLGLGLGLFQGASRRLLGPLRTLALAAVVGVSGLHLLPEALGGLGLVGVAVFALGLAIPRWIGRGKHAGHGGGVGLEIGFVGLLIHHLGDGLALGVYSRMDAEVGYAHGDVLMALVLHTVPLVAVVSAGYARARGRKSAVAHSLALAAASVAGILVTELIPETLVDRVEAWIAAGVAGLLLHGMSHDLTEDLPHRPRERVLDALAAAGGLLTGYIGAILDAGGGHSKGLVNTIGAELAEKGRAAALPLVLGLVLSALLPRLFAGRGKPGHAAPAPFARGFELEAHLLGVALLGWRYLWVLPIWATGVALSRLRRNDDSSREHAREGLFVERVDGTTAWAFSGLGVAAVLGSALSESALAPLGIGGALCAVVLLVIALPIHAVLAPFLAATLVQKGLWPAAGILLCALGPLFAGERVSRGAFIVLIVSSGLALIFGRELVVHPMDVPPALSTLALTLLGLLTLSRVYQLGFRGWFSYLQGAPCTQRSRSAKGSATTTGSPDASGASTPA